jgi:CRISPR-associated exonuclease Cas4
LMSGATRSSSPMIPIILVKEYAYCPRIAYFKYFTVWEPPTDSMNYAKLVKANLQRLLQSHGIEGTLYTEYPVRSKSLGIYGRVDAVVVADKRVHVVEVKLDTSKSRMKRKAFHHLVQLAAYAIAAEETFHKPLGRAMIAVLSRNKIIEVPVTPRLRKTVVSIVNELRRYIIEQKLPPRTPRRQRCNSCFYRKFCF